MTLTQTWTAARSLTAALGLAVLCGASACGGVDRGGIQDGAKGATSQATPQPKESATEPASTPATNDTPAQTGQNTPAVGGHAGAVDSEEEPVVDEASDDDALDVDAGIVEVPPPPEVEEEDEEDDDD